MGQNVMVSLGGHVVPAILGCEVAPGEFEAVAFPILDAREVRTERGIVCMVPPVPLHRVKRLDPADRNQTGELLVEWGDDEGLELLRYRARKRVESFVGPMSAHLGTFTAASRPRAFDATLCGGTPDREQQKR